MVVYWEEQAGHGQVRYQHQVRAAWCLGGLVIASVSVNLVSCGGASYPPVQSQGLPLSVITLSRPPGLPFGVSRPNV